MAAQIDLSSNGDERDAQVVNGEIVRQVNPLIQEGQWRSGKGMACPSSTNRE